MWKVAVDTSLLCPTCAATRRSTRAKKREPPVRTTSRYIFRHLRSSILPMIRADTRPVHELRLQSHPLWLVRRCSFLPFNWVLSLVQQPFNCDFDSSSVFSFFFSGPCETRRELIPLSFSFLINIYGSAEPGYKGKRGITMMFLIYYSHVMTL